MKKLNSFILFLFHLLYLKYFLLLIQLKPENLIQL